MSQARRSRKGLEAWVLGLLCASALLSAAAPAAPPRSFCNPDITTDDEHPLGYRERGDRCEGIYKEKVGSFGLALASFTGPLAGLDTRKKTTLELAWAPEAAGEVRIEVASLLDDVHYRMDTVQAASAGSFSWSTGIASRCALATPELGMLAVMAGGVGARPVYLPLLVRAPGAGGVRLPYRIVVVPGQRCDEIYWSLHSGGKALVSERRLNRGPYLPGVPVAFDLSEVAESGRYRLILAARLREGGSEALEIVFDHRPLRAAP